MASVNALWLVSWEVGEIHEKKLYKCAMESVEQHGKTVKILQF